MPSSSVKSEGESSSRRKKAGSSSNGQLTTIEKRIWQAAIAEPGHILTNEILQSRHADIRVEDQMEAINSLLAKSLFTAQKTQYGLQYQALTKGEAGVLGTLDSDESMIFSQIREAANEGIWTKQLKNRTNLHQTIMTRCLKSLEGKQLIKAVKSVKFPTRKIYMLAGLTPSIELSGGPWYTDNEMDSVFINQLCSILHKLISSKTWPVGSEGGFSTPLYLASHTSSLPTSATCLEWLRKNQVTTTPLKVEDVQSLLDVLVYDGKIEKIPCYPSRAISEHKKNRKGSRRGHDSQSESESESGSASQSGSGSGSESGSEESGSGSDGGRRRKRKHSSRSKSSSKRSKHKGSSNGSSRRHDNSHSSSKRSRYSKEDNQGKNSSFAKSIVLSSEEEEEEDDAGVYVNAGSQIFVYRAVRPFFVKTGWIEIPCGHCPVFNFCEPGGPVNAEGCVYMKQWIERCAKKDVDGPGDKIESNGHISDIEEASKRKSSKGKKAAVEEEAVAEVVAEEEEFEEPNVALGLEEQDQYDEYGDEEI